MNAALKRAGIIGRATYPYLQGMAANQSLRMGGRRALNTLTQNMLVPRGRGASQIPLPPPIYQPWQQIPFAPVNVRQLPPGMAGDPGLFGFIGKAVKAVAGTVGHAVGSVISSSPLGGMIRTVAGASPTPPVTMIPTVFQNTQGTGGFGGGTGIAGGVNIGGPGGFTLGGGIGTGVFGGGALAPGYAGGAGTALAPAGQCTVKGYHVNRTGYFTKHGYVAPGTKCVRNRRRNPLNPRAASRAIARLTSAGKAIKHIQKFLHRGAGGGGGRRRCLPPGRGRGVACSCK